MASHLERAPSTPPGGGHLFRPSHRLAGSSAAHDWMLMHAGTDPAVSPEAEPSPERAPAEPAAQAEPAEPADEPENRESTPARSSLLEPVLSFAVGDRRIVAMLVTLAGALFAFASRLRLDAQPWGDEPHYLVMSIALSKYHTFDLT